jgi:MFS family permease
MSVISIERDEMTARRRDWQAILLISLVHAISHFYQLVLPSLFAPLGAEFGLDFTALGLLVSVFYLVSGVGQAASGFVVDRVGGLRVLWFGLGCLIVAGALIGAANGYAMLLIASVVGGVGNAVFHPADFALINHRINPRRLGHAFSVHGLTGSLGWALAPVFIVTLTLLAGWRAAAFSAVAVLAAVLAVTVWRRDLLRDPEPARADAAGKRAQASQAGAPKPQAPAQDGVWQTLMMLARKSALWGAFLFFICNTISISGIQNYTIPLLGDLYGMSQVLASSALSGYMVANSAGMLAGGFLVTATARTENTVMVSLVTAGLILIILAMGWAPAGAAGLVVAAAGFSAGLSGPSRDMLIRRVTPKGAIGSVYGLVYSGMDVGSAVAPLCFGLLLDAGMGHGPWLGAGAAFMVSALLAQWIGRRAARAA